jgi:hypothetical protein
VHLSFSIKLLTTPKRFVLTHSHVLIKHSLCPQNKRLIIPFCCKLLNKHICTLRFEKRLKYESKTRRLEIQTKSLPDIFTHKDQLESKPSIQFQKGDVVNDSPDFIQLVNRKVESFPITVRIKEVKGRVEWK